MVYLWTRTWICWYKEAREGIMSWEFYKDEDATATIPTVREVLAEMKRRRKADLFVYDWSCLIPIPMITQFVFVFCLTVDLWTILNYNNRVYRAWRWFRENLIVRPYTWICTKVCDMLIPVLNVCFRPVLDMRI